MRRGFSGQHGSHGRKSARGIAAHAFRRPAIEWARRVGVLRRRSPDEARPVAARVRHCHSLKMVDVMQSIAVQGAGHCALAGRGRMERGTRCARCARARENGAIRAQDPVRCDPSIDTMGHRCAWQMSTQCRPCRRASAARVWSGGTFSGSRKSASADGRPASADAGRSAEIDSTMSLFRVLDLVRRFGPDVSN